MKYVDINVNLLLQEFTSSKQNKTSHTSIYIFTCERNIRHVLGCYNKI